MPKVLILTVGVTPTNYEGRAIFLHTSNLLSFQLGRSVAATLANSNPQVTVQIQTHIFKSHCGCLPKIQLHTISSTCRGFGLGKGGDGETTMHYLPCSNPAQNAAMEPRKKPWHHAWVEKNHNTNTPNFKNEPLFLLGVQLKT